MIDARVEAIRQMQQMQRQAAGQQQTQQDATEVSFGSMLKQYMTDVNDMQVQADDQIRRAIAGEDIDPHNVMLAVEKADIAFEMVMKIRNKMLEAYQEVMKTQV
ncbi:MAG: flagellar hook-basal body complex protein FliE [Candidatus Cloacimonetes bacterium]|nr:flagellar hook-basal body complex protein FliE [Candidatus Cloacimonadota bacterium]